MTVTLSLEILKAIADETRLKIISLLLEYDYCVGALSKRIGLSAAAISQHLQVLRKAGLVRGEKRGYWTHYTVEKNMIFNLATALEKLAGRDAGGRDRCRRGETESIYCPGGELFSMCHCKHPEKRPEQSEKCSAEQVRECHGDEREHECEEIQESELRRERS